MQQDDWGLEDPGKYLHPTDMSPEENLAIEELIEAQRLEAELLQRFTEGLLG